MKQKRKKRYQLTSSSSSSSSSPSSSSIMRCQIFFSRPAKDILVRMMPTCSNLFLVLTILSACIDCYVVENETEEPTEDQETTTTSSSGELINVFNLSHLISPSKPWATYFNFLWVSIIHMVAALVVYVMLIHYLFLEKSP